MSGISYAGEYEILELSIHSSSGNIFPLEPKTLTINLYESIFNNTITGDILILDTDNLVMNLPIIGQEYLSFKIKTPTLEKEEIDYTKHLMSVYKVGSRIPNQKSEAVILHFCSPEMLSSKRTRVSKSYTDTVDNIVLDLLESPKFANTSKNIFIEGTKGIHKIVSPNKTPYGLISDLSVNSISSVNNSPNYVFFENTKGIHFRTLESLYSQPSVGDFMLSDSADVDFSEGGVMNVNEGLKGIKSYQISGNNDTIKNIESGMLASKTIEYDIFQKRYDVQYHNYFDDFNEQKRVSGNNPLYNEVSVDSNQKTMGEYIDAKIFLHPTSKNVAGNDAQHDGSYKPNNLTKTIQSRIAKEMELTSGIKVIMAINGTTTLHIGAIIDIQVPIVGKNHSDDEYDLYNSGKFLITKLRHIFTKSGDQSKHEIIMTAIKDSINIELPKNSKQATPINSGCDITFV